MSNGINSAFAQNSFFTAETQQLQVLGFSGVGNSYPVYESEAYFLEDKPEQVLYYLKKFCF